MSKRKQIIAAVTVITVIFAVLFSALFIIIESEHDCSHHDCPICHHMEACEGTLKQLSFYVLTAALIVLSVYSIILPTRAALRAYEQSTLITLKVKLSN